DRRAGLPMQLLADARARGRVEHTGWRLRRDGSRFWGDVIITSMHDENGHVTGYAKVTRDRTDAKALEDAQDAFYAAFNHDFRTPITALKGFVDALRFTSPDAQEDLIARAEASADRLLGMVEGLVQFATHRAERATLMLADIDVAQVVRGAVQNLPVHIRPGRVRVSDDVCIARANGVAMQRVVTNLLVNALKYSPQDTPVLVDFSRPGSGAVRLSIRDEGRGIHPDDIDTIFDEFVRGRLAENDGGSGLGLASVRELMDQMEGSVAIDSKVGGGTTVTVDLPSTPPIRPSAPTQRTTSSPSVSGPVVPTS
ncbi:MAG: HAMP domain-containing sensor histidine kinase, partial [Marmoricola sp.]